MAINLGPNQDLEFDIDERLRAELFDTHTALPGRVKSYDAAKQRATVQIQIKREFEHVDGSKEEILISPLLEVPVLFPRAGGYSITFPVAVNDPCLVLFAERDIGGWLENGQAAVPPTARRHDYSDAVAILGLWPTPDALSPAASTSALAIRNDAGTTKIEVSSLGVLVQSAAAISIDSTTALTIDAGTALSLLAATVASLVGSTQAAIVAPLVTITSTGALVLSSTGAVTITRGANELLQILSEALDEIGTSTAGGDPLSNATEIAALKAKIDAMRTP